MSTSSWIVERGPRNGPLFLNRRETRLSRSGVSYILRRLANKAQLEPRDAMNISPHVIRHSTAMHLLQSGVDLTTIAAWLGHAHLSTTHGYVEIDLRMKQQAVALSNTLPALSKGQYPKGELLGWLESLGKSPRYAQRPPPIATAHLA
jgi:site-specific recombinase XerD